MGWHYAARQARDGDEIIYELVEVYPELGEKTHTENAVTVSGSSREDLAKWLRQAADDVMQYAVIYPETTPEQRELIEDYLEWAEWDHES